MPDLRRSLVVAMASVCLLAACGGRPTLAPGGGSAPVNAGASLPSKLQRSEAFEIVRSQRESVGTIDRIEAKLLTWAEYLDAGGVFGAVNADPKASPHIIGTSGFTGDADKRVVWVVAVSGQVWPQLREPTFYGPLPHPSATPYTPYRWGMFLVDAARGDPLGITDAGVDEDWPPLFAKLPDHPADVGASPIVDVCAAVFHLPDVAVRSRFPARTLAELTGNLGTDFEWMRLLQDVSGVRPGPMQDPRVPRCRVDLLHIGSPYFARAYPAMNGTWFVPLTYGSDVVLTAFVDVDAAGIGTLGGNRGGQIPVPTEADARRAASLPTDAVISAELILARPLGCPAGAAATVVWRLVRASGTAVYFALDVYGATPPGVLFEEKDMGFSTAGGLGHLASLDRAC